MPGGRADRGAILTGRAAGCPRGPGARAVTAGGPGAAHPGASGPGRRSLRPGRGGFRRSGPSPTSSRPTSSRPASSRPASPRRTGSRRAVPALGWPGSWCPGSGRPGSWGPRLIRAGPGGTGCGRPDPRRPRSAASGRGGTRAVCPGSWWPRPRSHGVRWPRSAGPGPGGACAVCPGRGAPGAATPPAGLTLRILGCRPEPRHRPSSRVNWRTPGPVRKRGRGDAGRSVARRQSRPRPGDPAWCYRVIAISQDPAGCTGERDRKAAAA